MPGMRPVIWCWLAAEQSETRKYQSVKCKPWFHFAMTSAIKTTNFDQKTLLHLLHKIALLTLNNLYQYIHAVRFPQFSAVLKVNEYE